jgi:hypothetical protein
MWRCWAIIVQKNPLYLYFLCCQVAKFRQKNPLGPIFIEFVIINRKLQLGKKTFGGLQLGFRETIVD